jgi:hypothetical protein
MGVAVGKYLVEVPFVRDMGSITPFVANNYSMESVQENALWHINSMRRHDNLRELTELPAGTKLTRIER